MPDYQFTPFIFGQPPEKFIRAKGMWEMVYLDPKKLEALAWKRIEEGANAKNQGDHLAVAVDRILPKHLPHGDVY